MRKDGLFGVLFPFFPVFSWRTPFILFKIDSFAGMIRPLCLIPHILLVLAG